MLWIDSGQGVHKHTSPLGARWQCGISQAKLQVPPRPQCSHCGWGRGWWLESSAVPVCEPGPPPKIVALWMGSRPAGTWVSTRCCYLKGRRLVRVFVMIITSERMLRVFWFLFDSPVLSRMMALSFGLKRASVLLRMNSTTTDWIRTSMNAAVPLKQADSICLDLEHSTAQPNSQLWASETCPSSLSQKH